MGGLVWLASYPKSGNTWVRIFLHNLITDSQESYDINKMSVLSVGEFAAGWYKDFLDKPVSEASVEEMASVRSRAHGKIAGATNGLIFVKTHNAMIVHGGTPTITPEYTAGAIYIVRNPLDVAVSYSHHLGLDIDSTIQLMNTSSAASPATDRMAYQVFGSWSEHVLSWTRKPAPSLFVIRYEDILAGPEIPFSALAEFLYLRPTARQLERAIENASFDKVRLQEEEQGFSERSEKSDRFFRKGESGQWKDVLSDHQVQAIVDAHHEQMIRFGYLRA